MTKNKRRRFQVKVDIRVEFEEDDEDHKAVMKRLLESLEKRISEEWWKLKAQDKRLQKDLDLRYQSQ